MVGDRFNISFMEGRISGYIAHARTIIRSRPRGHSIGQRTLRLLPVLGPLPTAVGADNIARLRGCVRGRNRQLGSWGCSTVWRGLLTADS